MVTLAQVRSQIADRPQYYPSQAGDPEIIGYADGAATIFGLTFENFVPGSLTIYVADAPVAGENAVFVAELATAYTVGTAAATATTSATNQVITFAVAPVAGSIIGARYQATAFSDADLADYLARVSTLYADDRTVLKAVQYDLIDTILADQRRLEMLAQGDYRRDPSAFQRGLLQLKAQLRLDLSGLPRPGASVPAVGIGVAIGRRYTPTR